MTQHAEHIIAEALDLSTDERALLVSQLLLSLHHTNATIDEQWAAEAEDRLDTLAESPDTIPLHDVLASLPKKL